MHTIMVGITKVKLISRNSIYNTLLNILINKHIKHIIIIINFNQICNQIYNTLLYIFD